MRRSMIFAISLAAPLILSGCIFSDLIICGTTEPWSHHARIYDEAAWSSIPSDGKHGNFELVTTVGEGSLDAWVDEFDEVLGRESYTIGSVNWDPDRGTHRGGPSFRLDKSDELRVSAKSKHSPEVLRDPFNRFVENVSDLPIHESDALYDTMVAKGPTSKHGNWTVWSVQLPGPFNLSRLWTEMDGTEPKFERTTSYWFEAYDEKWRFRVEMTTKHAQYSGNDVLEYDYLSARPNGSLEYIVGPRGGTIDEGLLQSRLEAAYHDLDLGDEPPEWTKHRSTGC